MKKCYIFCAGTTYPLHQRPEPWDLVLAADAGYLACQREGIIPDLLVGDFDSMEPPEEISAIVRAPVEKDDTDSLLAAKLGLERGCDEFHIYGGSGGKRLDHTLANLQMLLFLRKQGARGYLYDDRFVYTAICNETLLIPRGPEWGLLSVFCLGDKAEGVDETGVQYPLCNATLEPSFPLGVSNHILEEEARVTVRQGNLLVGWQL